eukprot:747654-Prymnesium_polylepis.1
MTRRRTRRRGARSTSSAPCRALRASPAAVRPRNLNLNLNLNPATAPGSGPRLVLLWGHRVPLPRVIAAVSRATATAGRHKLYVRRDGHLYEMQAETKADAD